MNAPYYFRLVPSAFSIDDVVRPSVTVDVVVLTVVAGAVRVLVIRRGRAPHLGELAFPGGFVHVDGGPTGRGESLDEAAARELQEETGLSADSVHLVQVSAFGKAGRDPRTRVISIAYSALVRPEVAAQTQAGSDAAEAFWIDVDDLQGRKMAFDHRQILDAVLARHREDLSTSTFALHLVPKTFTIAELRKVHEALLGEKVDAGNFHKRFQALIDDGEVVEVAGKRGVRGTARSFRRA